MPAPATREPRETTTIRAPVSWLATVREWARVNHMSFAAAVLYLTQRGLDLEPPARRRRK